MSNEETGDMLLKLTDSHNSNFIQSETVSTYPKCIKRLDTASYKKKKKIKHWIIFLLNCSLLAAKPTLWANKLNNTQYGMGIHVCTFWKSKI